MKCEIPQLLVSRSMQEVTRVFQIILCFGKLYGEPRRKIVIICYRESVRQDFCYVHFLLCKNAECAELHYRAETRREVLQELKISRSPHEGTPITAFSVKLSGHVLQLDTLFSYKR